MLGHSSKKQYVADSKFALKIFLWFIGAVLIFSAIWWYQKSQVTSPKVIITNKNNVSHVTFSELASGHEYFLKVDLSSVCSNRVLSMKSLYAKGKDLNTTLILDGYGSLASVVFPISKSTDFRGIDLSAMDRNCIGSVVIEADNNRKQPFAWLLDKAKEVLLEQSDTKTDAPQIMYYENGKLLKVINEKESLDEHEVLPKVTTLPVFSNIVTVNKDSIRVKGDVSDDKKMFYFGRLSVRSIYPKQSSNSMFFAEATLRKGALTVGLIDQVWVKYINLTTPGRYVVLLKITHPGAFIPTLAFIVPGFNSFDITKLGWL